jgi:GntR family transcriptional regulator, transcriptional repressor for pyruvate dehydrogenase complex
MTIDLGQINLGQIKRSDHLPTRIAAQFAGEINEGRLSPGDKLPTEHVLAKTLGVSRSVIREAIAQLRNEGLVETRQGVGAFVLERSLRPIRIKDGELFDPHSFRAMFQLRVPLEIEAAGLAAVHHTPADLSRIDAALDRMTGAEKWSDQGIDADLAFHRAVADATHNEYFSMFIGFIAERISLAINAARSRAVLEEIVEVTIAEHTRLRDAIASRNPTNAREAMRLHMHGAASRIELSLEQF